MNSLPNRPLQRARLGALVGGIVLVAATLTVPAAALAAATQNRLSFAVASVNPPPLTGTAGVALNFVFSVHINDPSDTLITTGPFATAPVTLAMTPNAVAASVSCPGGLTVNAVGGIAQFPGCVVTAPGTGLSFTATSPGSAPATSTLFNILASGVSPVLTIGASRSVILWGEGIDLTVQLTAPAGSSASVANRTIHVQVARVHAPGDFTTINPGGDVVTDAMGRATITGYTPATNLWYRAIYDGSADIGPVASADTRVVVRQLAALKPDNAGTTRTIAKGTSIEFRTVVRPSRDDVPRTHVTWQLWRLVNTRWTLFLTQASDPDVAGLAFFTVGFNTGSWRLRSQALPTQLNANSAWTPYVQFLVK